MVRQSASSIGRARPGHAGRIGHIPPEPRLRATDPNAPDPAGGHDMPDPSPMPAPGDAAPPIDQPDTQGGRFVLADHLGKWIVVYFYPRANTPG